MGVSTSSLAYALALDATGAAYVTGTTTAADFPTTKGAFSQTLNGAGTDGFALKLAPDGSALEYATLFGGPSEENVRGMALDTTGNVYITGSTGDGFPTSPGAFSEANNGVADVYVIKLNHTGTSRVYATYLGGELYDSPSGIALDVEGNAYIAGNSSSGDYPVTPGALMETPKHYHYMYSNAFVTKLNSTGTGLAYSTYLSGGSSDSAFDIAVNSAGNAFVAGNTSSSDFPIVDNGFNQYAGFSNKFYMARLNSTGSDLIYSVKVGPAISSFGLTTALDAHDNLHVTGGARSTDFPLTSNAIDNTFNGRSWDAALLKLNASGTNLYYSSYFGGESDDYGTGIALDDAGAAYLVGFMEGPGTPTTSGAFDDSLLPGEQKIFIAKHDLCNGAPPEVEIHPQHRAQGLAMPNFIPNINCAPADAMVDWLADPPSSIIASDSGVTFEQTPSGNVTLTLSVNDGQRTVVSDEVTYLVAAYELYFDYNGDNLNNLQDLWDLAARWGEAEAQDPNNDGVLNVLDLLYINTSDPMPFP